MLKSGLLAGCDRCGLTKFFEDDEENDKMSSADYLASGWKFKDNKHLCPVCVSLYDERFHTFMNEVIK